jgi:FixJ family two-component response regulator
MIFVIDEDDDTRDSLRVLLETEGLAASGFASTGAFLEECRPTDQDCLILDLNQSGNSGLELLDRLRRHGNRILVVVIASQATATTRRRAEELGAVAVLEKPYAAETLLALVRQH